MSIDFEVFSDVAYLANDFKGILLDAFGVFWNGNGLGFFPGAKEKMEQLVASGKIVGILSNSSQIVAREKNKYQSDGLIEGKHFHFMVTSGEVARSIFLNRELPYKKYWIFGENRPEFSPHIGVFEGTHYIETLNIDEADFIYISIPRIDGHDQTNVEIFRRQIENLRKIPMVCPNPDRFVFEGNPSKIVVRQGSVAAMYEAMGGEVFYIGKPHERVYSFAMDHFEKHQILNPAEILMVGDTPETDIRGSRLFGMSSALVTRTGIMADRISQKGLKDVLQTLDPRDTPYFLIERL